MSARVWCVGRETTWIAQKVLYRLRSRQTQHAGVQVVAIGGDEIDKPFHELRVIEPLAVLLVDM